MLLGLRFALLVAVALLSRLLPHFGRHAFNALFEFWWLRGLPVGPSLPKALLVKLAPLPREPGTFVSRFATYHTWGSVGPFWGGNTRVGRHVP